LSGYNSTFYERNLPTVSLTAANILYDDSNTNLPAATVQEAIEALKHQLDTLIGLKVIAASSCVMNDFVASNLVLSSICIVSSNFKLGNIISYLYFSFAKTSGP